MSLLWWSFHGELFKSESTSVEDRVGIKPCTKIAYPVLEQLRKENRSSSSSWRTYSFICGFKRNMLTTERADDYLCITLFVWSIWSLMNHLKLDALSFLLFSIKSAFYLAYLFQISNPLYSYLICNALLTFFMHLYIYSPYPKSIFGKLYHRIHIPIFVSPYHVTYSITVH
jgi:hypothetical protein